MHLLSSNLLPPLQLVLCDSEVQDLIFQRLQPLPQSMLVKRGAEDLDLHAHSRGAANYWGRDVVSSPRRREYDMRYT